MAGLPCFGTCTSSPAGLPTTSHRNLRSRETSTDHQLQLMLPRIALLSLGWLLASALHAELPKDAAQLLQTAGNTNDDLERQSALEAMAALPSLDDTQRKEATSLAGFVRQWNGKSLKF